MAISLFNIVPSLDIAALERIKDFRYKTNGLTFIEVHIFEHWWNFVVYLTPRWVAPNLMTLLGLLLPLI